MIWHTLLTTQTSGFDVGIHTEGDLRWSNSTPLNWLQARIFDRLQFSENSLFFTNPLINIQEMEFIHNPHPNVKLISCWYLSLVFSSPAPKRILLKVYVLNTKHKLEKKYGWRPQNCPLKGSLLFIKRQRREPGKSNYLGGEGKSPSRVKHFLLGFVFFFNAVSILSC